MQGNNDSNGSHLELCGQAGLKPYPARFSPQLPEFFVNFLTDEGDLVLDIFAGSNTTGAACEQLRRRWLAFELERHYLDAGRLRFPKFVAEIGIVESEDSTPDGQFTLPLRRTKRLDAWRSSPTTCATATNPLSWFLTAWSVD